MSARPVKLLTQIARAEALDESVAEAEATEVAAKTTSEDARKARAAEIASIRERITTGESTGDIALDIKICVEYTLEKDSTYENLVWLNDQLSLHSGELIALVSSGRSGWLRALGILPEDAALPLLERKYSSLHDVSLRIPLALTKDGTKSALLTLPYLCVMHQGFSSPFGGDTPSEFLIIGDDDVQMWLESLTDARKAYELWETSKKLDHALELTPLVFTEYMKRREFLIPQITDTIKDLKALKEQFKKYQHRIDLAIEDRALRQPATPTQNGVELEFKVVDDIEAATTKLNELVDTALNELHMQDSDVVVTACRLLGRTVE